MVVVTRPPMLFEGAVAADHGVVTFQLEAGLEARVNGGSANADTIALWKRATDYRGYQQSRLTHCSLFVTDAFSTRGWLEPTPGGRMLAIGKDNSSNLRTCVGDIVRVIRRDPVRTINPNVLKGMEQSIFGSLDETFSNVMLSPGRLATGRHLATCRRAREYLRESRFSVQSNIEVAAACDVPVRTLHNAFVSVLGMSPQKYLLLHRLWSVREALLRASVGDLVKSIALDHGFWHLGRFSSVYQSRFGESPSTTLAKRGSIR